MLEKETRFMVRDGERGINELIFKLINCDFYLVVWDGYWSEDLDRGEREREREGEK